MKNLKDIKAEARHFNQRDMKKRRKVSWSRLASPYAQRTLYPGSTRNNFLTEIGTPKLPGLTFACGDMVAEAKYFKLLKSSRVDAFDISDKAVYRAKEHCKKLGLNMHFALRDVNTIKLQENHYGLVVLNHSYHHLSEIEYLAEQVAKSLLPEGIFLLLDYIGPRCIQFTPQQLKYANEALQMIPPSLRKERLGKVMEMVNPPLRWGLSAHEAIQSHKILPAIESNFKCIKGLLFGGLMHPVLERIAASFDPNNIDHAAILDKLWCMEKELMENCKIEPNFCELILVRKDSPVFDKYPEIKFEYRHLEIDKRYEWLIDTSSKEIWRLKKIIQQYEEISLKEFSKHYIKKVLGKLIAPVLK